MLGQGIETLLGKSADREDGGPCIPKNHLTRVRIQASFLLKGEGVWLVVVNFLMPESFVLAAVHLGQVTMFL